MKKVLKKVTAIIMSAAFAVSMLTASGVETKAATALNVNQEYKLTLGPDQLTEYTFVTQPDCTTSVTACIVGGSSNTGFAWMKMTVDYCKYDSVSVDNGKGAASTGTFIFAPGKTATLTFNSLNVGTKKTIDIAFTVNSTPVSNLEKEGNNSPNSATKIKLKKGKKYYIKFSSTGHKAVPVQIRVKKVK